MTLSLPNGSGLRPNRNSEVHPSINLLFSMHELQFGPSILCTHSLTNGEWEEIIGLWNIPKSMVETTFSGLRPLKLVKTVCLGLLQHMFWHNLMKGIV